MSQNRQPVVHRGGDPEVSECIAQQWLVAGKNNSGVLYHQTDSNGGQAGYARRRQQNGGTWHRVISQLSLVVKLNDRRSNDGSEVKQTFNC